MEAGSSTHLQSTQNPNPSQQPDPENDDIISRSINAEPTNRTDEQILPSRYHKDMKPNNHYLDFDTYNHSDHLLLEILKGHPLHYALSATATAPNIYVQQLWHSLTYVSEGIQGHFDFQIDNMELTINLHHFRRVLHLPRRQQMPDNEFESFAEESVICRELEFLGYREHIPSLWMFKRKHLPGRWNYLFPILLKCLTAQATGFDKANRNFYQLYHAFVFGRNVDFATPIWSELRDYVLSKGKPKAKTYIPFLRFFQLLIARCMRQFPEISRRPADAHPYTPPKLRYQIERLPAEEPGILIVPGPLLQYADPQHPAVIAYRALHYPEVAMG